MRKPTSQEFAACLRVLDWQIDAQSYVLEIPVASVIKSLRESHRSAVDDETGSFLSAIQEADEKDIPRRLLVRPNYEGTQDYEFGLVQRDSIRLANLE